MDSKDMSKLELATRIESHYLFQGYFGKGDSRYDKEKEIEFLMSRDISELRAMYDNVYSEAGDEKRRLHELSYKK